SDPKAKRTALRELMSRADVKNAIVFCNRKTEVDVVAKSLKTHGFDAAPIHGDLDQSMRTRTLENFRKGDLTFLVASDVAARGLDIPAVSHVFNYDVPHHAEDYVHRIGRTGRAGADGIAISLVSEAELPQLHEIEQLLGRRITVEPAPDVAPRRGPTRISEGARQARPAFRDRGRGTSGRMTSGSRRARNGSDPRRSAWVALPGEQRDRS
ncbi:MAG: C-terminal helicase domain-containing protein, partial [Chloroflexi bacterium]|nr:C-terminal helicase domain-containing protein [Chloroflexota bacterium]